jgi:two-component system alkaline phosphatase synthesis response regulator PhoP
MKNLLIVEDSEFISGGLKIVLEREDYKIFKTDDGSKVIDIITQNNIGLVILDLNMPKMSGEDVFKLLKANPETKKVKVIILTAKADALKWDSNLKQCDKFIPKPFDKNELINTVKELFP